MILVHNEEEYKNAVKYFLKVEKWKLNSIMNESNIPQDLRNELVEFINYKSGYRKGIIYKTDDKKKISLYCILYKVLKALDEENSIDKVHDLEDCLKYSLETIMLRENEYGIGFVMEGVSKDGEPYSKLTVGEFIKHMTVSKDKSELDENKFYHLLEYVCILYDNSIFERFSFITDALNGYIDADLDCLSINIDKAVKSILLANKLANKY